MKLLFLLMLCIPIALHAQIISQFTWDDPSVAINIADIGPDGTVFSSSAISDVGGVGGTNGLNAALPKLDINMTIPGSPTFDVTGIDVSFDYQREESQCDWWRRGNSLIMDGSNQFSVSYRVEDGVGGFNTVNSGNVFNIPNDDTYRNYRFVYLPTTGEGFALVDGVVVWTNDGPDNRPLYWTGAGDVTVGSGCDGSGGNDTFLDNLIVASVTSSPLPIELLTFDVKEVGKKKVKITWESASESNNEYYTIERSMDGLNWEVVGTVEGANNSSQRIKYKYMDEKPWYGLSYYRLSQTDYDGASETFRPRSIRIQNESELSLFPNPAQNEVNLVFDKKLELNEIHVFNLVGQEVTSQIWMSTTDNKIIFMDIAALDNGVYIIKAGGKAQKFTKN